MKSSQIKKLACALATAAALCGGTASLQAGDAYATAVEALNPVVYFKLNEAPTLVQTYWATNLGSTGAAENGVYLGSGFTEPYLPGAILGDTNDPACLFTGSGPYSTGVSIPWSASINPAPVFSTECWANYQGTPGGELTAPFASIDAGNDRAGWTFYANGNAWYFRMGDANGYIANFGDSGLLQAGVWVHLVGVTDGTNAYLYENGVLVNQTPVVRPFLGNIGETTDIGTSTSFNRQIDAIVTDCAIYNYALTSNQIAAHYAAGVNSTPTTPYKQVILGDNPVGFWPVDDGAAPAATPGPTAVNSGTLAAAADGTYLPGTTVGAPGVPFPGFGTDTNAAYFNGVISGIEIPAIDVQTDSFTYTCWIESTAIQEGNAGWPGFAPLIAQGSETYYASDDPVFLGYWADGYTLSALWFEGPTNVNGADYGLLPTVQPVPFVWNFVACVWTPTGTTIYVNGQAYPIPGAGPHTTHDFSQVPLWIGADDTINSAGNYAGSTETGASLGSDWIFEGYIAHPAIFATALTSNQIQSLYAAAVPLPQITSLTQSPVAPNYEGQTITLTAATLGLGTPTYQWLEGGSPLSGQTAASLVLSNVTTSSSGNYSVVVSNPNGSVTSAPVALLVSSTKPIIVAQPQPATRYPASSATFNVSAIGSSPISYTWSFNSTPISGATNPSYTAVAGTSTAGNYSVVLSNALGSTPSSDALLTVLPNPIGYVGAVAAAQPTAYWRLDETSGSIAYDYAGGFNGNLTENVTNDVPGPIFPGLPANNVSCIFNGIGSKIRCPAIPVNSNTITVVALAQESPTILFPAGASIFVSSYGANNDIAYLGVGFGGGGDYTDLQYNWNNDTNTYTFDPANSGTNWSFPAGTWCFIAETIAATNAVLYMDDGDGHLAAASNNVNSSMMIITNAVLPLNVEVDLGGNASINTGDNSTWGGGLDQIAYWKRTLSYAEIAALHNALVTQLPAVTAGLSGTNIQITFSGGTLQSTTSLSAGFTDVPGNPTSPYTPPPGSPAQFFRVKN
jgi:hypothetical protein